MEKAHFWFPLKDWRTFQHSRGGRTQTRWWDSNFFFSRIHSAILGLSSHTVEIHPKQFYNSTYMFQGKLCVNYLWGFFYYIYPNVLTAAAAAKLSSNQPNVIIRIYDPDIFARVCVCNLHTVQNTCYTSSHPKNNRNYINMELCRVWLLRVILTHGGSSISFRFAAPNVFLRNRL